MECPPRKTLRFDHWADLQVRTNPRLILELSIVAADALRELHDAAKAHGNISPRTLLILEDGTLCRSSFDQAAQGRMVDDTVYAPPEAYADEDEPRPATAAGDIYALTAVLYRALQGQTPVRATLRPVAAGKDRLTLPREFGEDVRQLLARGLSLKEEDRPKGAQAFRELLEKAAQSKEIKALVVPPPPPKGPDIAKRFPRNLTVGKVTEIAVKDLIKDKGAWEIRFTNLEEHGLSLDALGETLVCKPTLAGEKQLALELNLPATEGRPACNRTASIEITVNPDPDSLWKDLPVNPDAPYQKSNTLNDELVTPAARIIAASQRGRSHAHEGLFREDDFRITHDAKTGWYLLAVSDGAGSSKFSRRGSEIACEQSIEFMSRWLSENPDALAGPVGLMAEKGDATALRTQAYHWLAGAAVEARKSIQKQAEAHEPPASLRDFHATLLLAATCRVEKGWVIVTFSVGDGGIAYCDKAGNPTPMCTPDSGEFSGQTVFLTVQNVLRDPAEIMARIHVAHVAELDALVLMTDGVTDPLFPTESCLSDPAVWKAFWSGMNEVAQVDSAEPGCSDRLLKWLSFKSPGNHDDRTLAILMPADRKPVA